MPDDVFLIQLSRHPIAAMDGLVHFPGLPETLGMDLAFPHKGSSGGSDHVVFHPYDRGVHKNQRSQTDPDGGARYEGTPLVSEQVSPGKFYVFPYSHFLS
jgi:hypothetical protein